MGRKGAQTASFPGLTGQSILLSKKMNHPNQDLPELGVSSAQVG
jgi:hypothetical protein